MTPNILRETAPAKINLTMDILRRRADGYHDIETVLQTVSLSDAVEVTEAGTAFSLVTEMPLPQGLKTLEQRAAEAFFQHLGRPAPPLRVTLQKHIPTYAGLGGGSADVAALLRYLRRRYAPEMTWETLEGIALSVGSDVPFCLRGGTALAQGRGEVLTALPPLPPCWVVLCKPGFDVSTEAAFLRAGSAPALGRPDTARMRQALLSGDLSAVGQLLCNVFVGLLEPSQRQEAEGLMERMRTGGAIGASMSGSGPTVFGLFCDLPSAHQIAERLRRDYAQTYVVQPVAEKSC